MEMLVNLINALTHENMNWTISSLLHLITCLVVLAKAGTQ